MTRYYQVLCSACDWTDLARYTDLGEAWDALAWHKWRCVRRWLREHPQAWVEGEQGRDEYGRLSAKKENL